jgi:hypothetical protein
MAAKAVSPTQRLGIWERVARYRLVAGRRDVRVLTVVAVVCAATAVPALASPVPGATYNGRTANGAYVRFTVSANGTQVDSYEITGVVGDTCQFSAQGTEPAFPGAPIKSNAFTYGFDQAFSLSGRFPGARSATGTFHFHRDAIGAQPACDSGVVRWTATTTAGTAVKTRVSLHTMALSRLGGRITAKSATCTRGRTVRLWRGKHELRSTRSGKGGSFWFAHTAALRGRRVHVTVAKRAVRGAICGAASSNTVGA